MEAFSNIAASINNDNVWFIVGILLIIALIFWIVRR